MSKLFEINVKLSENQKKNLINAYNKKETIVLRLSKWSLTGSDTLYVPETVKKRLEKNKRLNKGVDIKLSKTNIRKQVGGSLFSTALNLGRLYGPTIAKTIGLSALGGLASEGASQIVKAISGKGAPRVGRPPRTTTGRKDGGFLVPKDNVSQLMNILNLFTMGQKNDIMRALQTSSDLLIKPTKKQTGGAIGTILASIGIPMLLSALTGRGAPQMGRPPRTTSGRKDGGLVLPMGKYTPSLPFFGSWNNYGRGKKKTTTKKRKRSDIGKKQPVQKHSNNRRHILKPKFYGKKPVSNHDLIEWCDYLNIPINNVPSRDMKVPHNHKQALFIYNLEPSYMSGSHWVATYAKNGVINYFDSFGMPPFQEIVNHAKRENLTLLHQDNQIQDIETTTCGYFCLYFLNEMNKGNSYFNLLKPFDIHDVMNTEKFIKHYFENI